MPTAPSKFCHSCLCLSSSQFSSVQSLSRVQLFVNPWITALQASLSITNSRSSLKLMSIESVMPSSHLILCCPFLLLPSIPPSIRVFSNESALHISWPKYWSFSFYISLSNEHSKLISFRMDWLDLLAVQGTLKSLLQHHSSKQSNNKYNTYKKYQFSSVQSLSRVRLFVTPWSAAHQASLSITNSWSLFMLMSIESVMPSNHLILCRPPSPPALNLSQHQGLFKWVSSSHQLAKVLEFQLQH